MDRLENREQPEYNQPKAYPEMKIGQNDPRDERERSQDTAHQAPPKLKVTTKETTHTLRIRSTNQAHRNALVCL